MRGGGRVLPSVLHTTGLTGWLGIELSGAVLDLKTKVQWLYLQEPIPDEGDPESVHGVEGAAGTRGIPPGTEGKIGKIIRA